MKILGPFQSVSMLFYVGMTFKIEIIHYPTKLGLNIANNINLI